MAEELECGKRFIKVRRDSAYSYDEKVLNALVQRNSNESESWHQCSDNDSNCVSINENASSSKKVSNFKINEVSSWIHLSRRLYRQCCVLNSTFTPFEFWNVPNSNIYFDNALITYQ